MKIEEHALIKNSLGINSRCKLLVTIESLDNGYSIFLTEYKNNIPPGIDTEDDLIIANKFLESL
jgi:CMP-2-keto-3-deoxyoctulosonic acid synthetase